MGDEIRPFDCTEQTLRNRLDPATVIPAKAGIQTDFCIHEDQNTLDSRLRGNDDIWARGLNGYNASGVWDLFKSFESNSNNSMKFCPCFVVDIFNAENLRNFLTHSFLIIDSS